MNLREIVNRATLPALAHWGDSASAEFYRRLAEGSFATTRCPSCRALVFPPRPFCPRCWAEPVEWEELPRRGKLHAASQQGRGIRFLKPNTIGLVDLGEVRVLSRIDAPFDSLRPGMDLELDFFREIPGLVLHQFRPIAAGAHMRDPGQGESP